MEALENLYALIESTWQNLKQEFPDVEIFIEKNHKPLPQENLKTSEKPALQTIVVSRYYPI